MKNIICLFLVLFALVSCSSKDKSAKKASAKTEKLAKSYDPIIDVQEQRERIVGMIQNDEKLDNKKKKDLVQLVDSKTNMAIESIKKKSQLRAALIHELLQSSTGKTSNALAIEKEMERINKQNIKELDNFILEFKAISGERDIKQYDMMEGMATSHLM